MPYVGLGDSTVQVGGKSITVDAAGNWVAPWYCYVGWCSAPSAVEVEQANALANISATVRANNPGLTQSTVDAQNQAAARYCADNPQECAAAGDPLGSAIAAGFSPFTNLSTGLAQTLQDVVKPFRCGLLTAATDQPDGSYTCDAPNWLVIAGLGVGAVLFLQGMRGGRRR